MIIRKLKLRYWCQYSKLDLEFSPYLNGVVGPNGSGKTNMMQAILYALTGQIGTEGVKADNINDRIPEGEQTNVTLVMTHGGTEYTIERPVIDGVTSRGRNEPTISGPGGVLATGATGVNDYILQLLGVTTRQIVDYVFVGQEQVSNLFKATDGKRAEDLMRLFGVDRATKLHKLIGDYANAVEIPAEPEGMDIYQHQLAEVTESCGALAAKMADFRSVPADLTEYTQSRQQLITQASQRHEIVTQQQAMDTERLSLHEQLEPAKEELATNEADVAVLKSALLQEDEAAIAVRRDLGRWDVYDAQQQQRQQAESLTQQVAQAEQTMPLPIPAPTNYVAADDQAFQNQLQTKMAAVTAAGTKITELEATDGECPTCGQVMPDRDHIQAELEIAKQNHATLSAEYAPLKQQWDHSRYNDADNKPRKVAQDHLFQLRQQLATLKAVDQVAAPTIPKEQLQQQLQGLEQLRADVNAAVTNGAKFRERVNQLGARNNYLTTQITTLGSTLAQLPVITPEAVTTAQAEINTMTQRWQERQQLMTQLNGEQQRKKAAQDMITMLENQQEQRRIRLAAKQYISELRGPFHHEEAPRVVSYTYLEQMTAEVNRVLELFQAPFRVDPDDNLSFQARFYDNRTKPAKRLSVGQLVVLSLAFRIAVNSTFATQLGLFAPDEPTAGLDASKLECIPAALERLRELSETRGLQVIFVTHHESLMPAFDNVITIGELTE